MNHSFGIGEEWSKVTLEKYNLFPAYRGRYWGTGSVIRHNRSGKEKERNHRLKLLLAEKELESSLKDELIKKISEKKKKPLDI